MATYRIERLGKQDRSRFDCGVPELDQYLQKQAGQDERRRVAACYLLLEQLTGEIVGYYTLSAGSILLADLPEKLSKKLPRYPTVPVVRIGRFSFRLPTVTRISQSIIRIGSGDVGNPSSG